MASYATNRKIKIIEERYGFNWQSRFEGRSIDSVYKEITGDDRETLFCKIDADKKQKLNQMVKKYDVDLGTLMEQWIDEHYKDFSEQEETVLVGLASEYS